MQNSRPHTVDSTIRCLAPAAVSLLVTSLLAAAALVRAPESAPAALVEHEIQESPYSCDSNQEDDELCLDLPNSHEQETQLTWRDSIPSRPL